MTALVPQNPKYSNAAQTQIDIEVPFEGALTWTTVQQGSALFTAAAAGTYGAVAAYAAPTPPAPTQAGLLAYASAKQLAIATGSITVNIGTSGAPQSVKAAMDALSLAWLNGAAALASGNAAASFTWSQPTGAVTLTSAQVLAIYAAVQTFIQSTFATLGPLLTAIAAGTIATTAQIDAPPAPIPAWPVNS